MAKKTVKLENPVKKTPTEFDHNKQYRWNSDDQIVLNGSEFEVIYKALTTFSAGDSTNVPSIIGLIMATNVAQGKMVEYVQNGMFKEVVAETIR